MMMLCVPHWGDHGPTRACGERSDAFSRNRMRATDRGWPSTACHGWEVPLWKPDSRACI